MYVYIYSYIHTHIGIPNPSWLSADWNIDSSSNLPWIQAWDKSCDMYNEWRYGLDNLQGYAKAYFSTKSFASSISGTYQYSINCIFFIWLNVVLCSIFVSEYPVFDRNQGQLQLQAISEWSQMWGHDRTMPRSWSAHILPSDAPR